MPTLSIVIDCDEETERHEIHIDKKVIQCNSLEELADMFEALEKSYLSELA